MVVLCNPEVALMATAISDRIQRTVELKSSRERVWNAITTEAEFEQWFGVKFLEGRFQPGARMRVRSTHPGYEHIEFDMTIEKMDAPKLFSWRWIPGATQPKNEPTTLVEFTLEDLNPGTRLTITESGFDRLSLSYRAAAYKDNTGGWEYQAKSLTSYLEKNS
jgi:uncharacterized protein YndB with AHSA1/START domain